MNPLNEYIQELKGNGYHPAVKSKEEIINWIEKYMPNIIQQQVVETGSLKQCGTLSTFIAGIAAQAGFIIGIQDVGGHYIAVFITDDLNSITVDATHLQFKFPFHGGLRDFSREEREDVSEETEYKLMNLLMKDLKHHPMRAVKISFHKGFPFDMDVPPARSMLFDPKI